jgi:hypothetical protein
MTETNTNLAIWNAVEQTDPAYTKQFSKGGGFKGTATNATYLAKKATNQFGPIGIGWGWNVVNETYQPGQDKDIIHVVRIKLWYMWNGQKGEIEQFGQTQFVGKNKNGYFTDEEAPKKSMTDAVSKCLSLLGFAADIHLGMYDDNRYVNDLKKDFRDGDEFGGNAGSNDNTKDSGSDKGGNKPAPDDAARVTPEEADKIVAFWEGEIAKCKTGKEVLELVGDQKFKDDCADLSADDDKYLKEKASARSKELKAAKTNAAA